MKIVFFGTPHFAVPTLEKLISHDGFEVVAVVTQPDKPRDRGNKLTPSPIKNMATNHNIPVWQPARIKKDPETLQKLRDAQADAFVVVAYGQILSPEILEMPRLGCINVHGSILPAYRGAAPIQWSLVSGDRETGITTMQMDAGMDTGAMLCIATTPISLLDNASTLAGRLETIGADLLIETLIKLDQNQIQATPQDNNLATYARLIKKEDFVIDWSKPALELHNQIRGFYPNCVTTWNGQPLKIHATIPLVPELDLQELPPELQKPIAAKLAELSQHKANPGEIIDIIKNIGAIAQTVNGALLLYLVQPAGKKVQSGWDFVNGSRLQIGQKLGI